MGWAARARRGEGGGGGGHGQAGACVSAARRQMARRQRRSGGLLLARETLRTRTRTRRCRRSCSRSRRRAEVQQRRGWQGISGSESGLTICRHNRHAQPALAQPLDERARARDIAGGHAGAVHLLGLLDHFLERPIPTRGALAARAWHREFATARTPQAEARPRDECSTARETGGARPAAEERNPRSAAPPGERASTAVRNPEAASREIRVTEFRARAASHLPLSG
jgi:hypothetical protein